MIRISGKAFRILGIHIVLLVLANTTYWLFDQTNPVAMMRIIVYFSIIGLLIFLCSMLNLGNHIFGLSGLFVVFSYLFHFGQAFINVFFPDYHYTTRNMMGNVDAYSIRALMYSLNVILIVSMAVLISAESNKHFLEKWIHNTLDIRQIKAVAWIIFLITFPLEAYYFYRQSIAAAISITYGATSIYSLGFSGWYVQLASLSVVGIAMLICIYSEINKKVATMISILGFVFYFLSMLSGSRIYAVVSICVIFYCYIHFVKRIKLSLIILMIIGGYFLLAVLHSIMRLRQNGAITLASLLTYVTTSDSNYLLGIIEEFGGTLYTVIVAQKEIPSNISFNYGLSYIGSLATIGINIGGILNEVIKNVEFTLRFQTQYSFGGSYIGELYYNFGYLGYLFAPFVGLLIGRISGSLEYYANKKDIYRFSMLIMPMYAGLIWVRSYFDIMTRNTAWAIILIVLTSLLVKTRSRN